MTDFPEMTAQDPVDFWNRPITLDFPKLIKSTCQLGFSYFWPDAGVISDGIEGLVTSFRIKPQKPEGFATILLQAALLKTYDELIKSLQGKDVIPKDIPKKIPNDLSGIVRDIPDMKVTLTPVFFEKPQNMECIPFFKEHLKKILLLMEASETVSGTTIGRFESYFIYHLYREEREKSEYYAPLFEMIRDNADSPYYQSLQQQKTWWNYIASQKYEIDQPLFEEAFSLRQIYIHLNVYRVETKKGPGGEKTEKRIVTRLEESLKQWFDTFDHIKDPFRIISGDPGSGKTAATRMFLNECLDQGQGKKAVYIPLQRFTLDEKPLKQSIADFCREQCGFDDIFADRKLKLLLIFDGLDELSKQGAYGANVASHFMDGIMDLFSKQQESQGSAHTLVLISGRPLVMDSVIRRVNDEASTLFLLPYYVDKNEREKVEFVDEKELLTKDYRDEWWKKYGDLKGKQDYGDGMPEQFRDGRVSELTSRPLLNYLVALANETGKIDFSSEVSVNEIYDHIVMRIFARQWDGKFDKYRPIKDINEEQFRRLLEEMAMIAWHHNDRIVSIKSLMERCSGHSSLQKPWNNINPKENRALPIYFWRSISKQFRGLMTHSSLRIKHFRNI